MLQTLLLMTALIGFSLLTITAPSVKQTVLFSVGIWAAIVGLCVSYLRTDNNLPRDWVMPIAFRKSIFSLF